ncbi:hypothetical protein C2845_PM08G15540 [Panicum miliaceum]|uniref:1,3-beta-glucan synthase n=1 Tax=Panicum miliaceum TaxID=4540 RepID=A0A3L6QVJ7_PANMI|nr:hypothetical protein C2845_PM08G15540 [Panicum miliaceum]
MAAEASTSAGALPRRRRDALALTLASRRLPGGEADAGERVPGAVAPEVMPFVRAADEVEPLNPRVAFLCRRYAFKKVQRMDPSSTQRGVRQFKTYMSIKLDQVTRWAEMIEDKGRHFKNYKYNIIPLNFPGSSEAIVELPEIRGAIDAINVVDGLPMPHMSSVHRQGDKSIRDLLDWLSLAFGFQKSNVENQRENMVLLLANISTRTAAQEGHPLVDSVNVLWKKIFENYKSWCRYLHISYNIMISHDDTEHKEQQLKLLHIGLYLLIWGEASNVRFMPECLCYIFHHMAKQLHDMVDGNYFQPPPGFEEEGSFLKNVIQPIFKVLQKRGAARKPKTNFVEVRTFLHIFRSFDRMWIFFILAFQAMLIVSWSSSGSLSGITDGTVFRNVLSIFITAAFLNFIKVTLDILFTVQAWGSMEWTKILRYLLKFVVAIAWMIILPVTYSSSIKYPSGAGKILNSWIGNWYNQSVYNVAIVIYMIPNILAALFFLLPPLQNVMERSNSRVFVLLMWWIQPRLYVGRAMHEDILSILKYVFFWAVLLISKLAFSFYVECIGYERELQARLHSGLMMANMAVNQVSLEKDILMAPSFSSNLSVIQWPPFLLASKIPAALHMALNSKEGDEHELIEKLKLDRDRYNAVIECYESLMIILNSLLLDSNDRSVVNEIDRKVTYSMTNKTFLEDFEMTEIGKVSATLANLLQLLKSEPISGDEERKIVNALQDFMEITTRDFMKDGQSVLTPYYNEEVLYSSYELNRKNEDGISILFYLQKIYPERIGVDPDDEAAVKGRMDDIRLWASYRGQTLARTVRGMMYYRRALELQCYEDMINDEADLGGEEAARSKAIADIKFTYVVSCQLYGVHKASKDSREKGLYENILNLMLTYPALRIAYIDEKEVQLPNGKFEKQYYSVLVKGDDEEIYRIRLPGKPTDVGEGKPNNQNHAIVFTRGEALQAIDMNQDNYLEEAFKMRNLLEEFLITHGKSKPTILGVREHIFTGSVSSLAWFMSNQETSFVTIGQRVLANPLKVRFHYGHPDVFDRLFHLTRGGISKASKVINLSEDIFAGFNSTLRRGNVTHHEYIQLGKGRDVGMNQISNFEAKVANGNGEQTLCRDIYRLGHRFDFYRMLSLYFTTVGFYFNSMVAVLTVYIFLYGRLYLVLSGLEKSILQDPNIQNIKPFENALATQSIFQLGMLLVLPMMMEVGLEKGFGRALAEFVIMQLQLAPVFFTFHLGTKTHYYGRTILHGGAKYRGTGRGFVVRHAKYAENYRMYSRSHFVKALELLILLVVYLAYGSSYRSSSLYLYVTVSIWFLVFCWLFAPFVFNPSCFEWHKTVDDWMDWWKWMGNRGGIGLAPEQSWEAWWMSEHDHLKNATIRSLLLEFIISLRFLIYQYGIVYHLHIVHENKSFLVYALSWLVIAVALVSLKVVSMGREKFVTRFQLVFRILKGIVFLILISLLVLLFVGFDLAIADVGASILAFIPTGWFILLIAQLCGPLFRRLIIEPLHTLCCPFGTGAACRGPCCAKFRQRTGAALHKMGPWDSIQEMARMYEYTMGLLIFLPIAVLSWFPFVSEFQTRLLFNQAFSRGLQISRILAGQNGSGTKRD